MQLDTGVTAGWNADGWSIIFHDAARIGTEAVSDHYDKKDSFQLSSLSSFADFKVSNLTCHCLGILSMELELLRVKADLQRC